MSTPRASIVIAAHNEGLNLYLTLHSIDETADTPYEIIVVDDGSTDGSTDFLYTYSNDRHRLVRAPLVGPAHARNIGANAARGEVIVFLDAHCFPRRGWLSRLVDTATAHPQDLITGCISAAGSPTNRGWGLTFVSPTFDVMWLPEHTPWSPLVPLAGAACMAVTTRRFFAVGGFYPFPVIGLEDVELCLRFWGLGSAVRLSPGVEVAHVFADRWRTSVRWADYYTNGLTIAFLYLDEPRLNGTLAGFARFPEFAAAIRKLDDMGIARSRERLQRRLVRAFGSFCTTFNIEWPTGDSPYAISRDSIHATPHES